MQRGGPERTQVREDRRCSSQGPQEILLGVLGPVVLHQLGGPGWLAVLAARSELL